MLSSIQCFKVIRSVLMVHHGLDYTRTWHLKKLCVLIAVGFDLWHPNNMYDYLKKWYDSKLLWVRLMPSYFSWDSAYLVWAWRCSISNILQWVHVRLFYVYSIIPHTTTPPIWQMFQVLLVYFDHMHIWKVTGCSNHGPIPFFDVVAAYFWMVLLGMEIWHVGQYAMFVFRRQE